MGRYHAIALIDYFYCATNFYEVSTSPNLNEPLRKLAIGRLRKYITEISNLFELGNVVPPNSSGYWRTVVGLRSSVSILVPIMHLFFKLMPARI